MDLSAKYAEKRRNRKPLTFSFLTLNLWRHSTWSADKSGFVLSPRPTRSLLPAQLYLLCRSCRLLRSCPFVVKQPLNKLLRKIVAEVTDAGQQSNAAARLPYRRARSLCERFLRATIRDNAHAADRRLG